MAKMFLERARELHTDVDGSGADFDTDEAIALSEFQWKCWPEIIALVEVIADNLEDMPDEVLATYFKLDQKASERWAVRRKNKGRDVETVRGDGEGGIVLDGRREEWQNEQ